MFRSLISTHISPVRVVGLHRSTTLMRMLSTKGPKLYDFEQVKKLVLHPDEKKLLVDVREPDELKDYKLPNSINIPLKSAPGALGLPEEEFEELFKFQKPSKDQELIFFCQLGMRAKASEELAKSYGYESTGVWEGSIKEWLEKGGANIKP
ncbi:thiosulfate sulfurtransferase RDL2 [Nakaseomyces bracarensis]|uniref:thiosulfate sulfurtransferase RDL2 n=1 Tax=Nakaseomyces bracarensis TaxID=273131 RepID=UPI0038720591